MDEDMREVVNSVRIFLFEIKGPLNLHSEGGISLLLPLIFCPPFLIPLRDDGQESNFLKGSDSFSSLSPCRPSSHSHKSS